VRPVKNTTIAAAGKNGTYTGLLFAEEAVRVIDEHSAVRATRPLFMYLALHDTHAPLEAPWSFVEPYAETWPDDKDRAIFSGMVSYVDETTKNVTDALLRTGMWDNTLLIWTTDNGSPIFVGGSNHPLKGGKGTNWEGGTRVPTFVTGGMLPASQHGAVIGGVVLDDGKRVRKGRIGSYPGLPA
jgi:arylsulfatase I/J